MKLLKRLLEYKFNNYNELIGPADKISKIRKCKFIKPENETKNEREYRLAKEYVQNWNHEYWLKYNERYLYEKKAYLEGLRAKAKDNDKPIDETDSSIMAPFYKSYLKKTSEERKKYKEDWNKLNLDFVKIAAKLFFDRLFSKNNNNKIK